MTHRPGPERTTPRTAVRWIAGIVAASSLLLAACSDDGDNDAESDRSSTTSAPDTETAGTVESDQNDSVVEVRQHVGPRAYDHTAGTMMVLDSLELDGDNIFVRLRIVNGSEKFLDLGVRDTLYGPIALMTDDLGNNYPALAVEPAGIDAWSVGDLRLRLQGPLDPNATDFTLQLETIRGLLVSGPVPAPRDDAVSWWLEQPRNELDEPIVSTVGGRRLDVIEVVDRGSHVSIAVVIDETGDELVDAISEAALTDADGNEFPLIPFEPASPASTDAATVVLRFVGPYGTASSPLRLTVAGVDVAVPSSADAEVEANTDSGSADEDTLLPASPRLSDLLHLWLTDEPLEASNITVP